MFTVEPGHGAHCTALIGTLTRTDVAQLRHTLDALLVPARPVILDVTRLSTQFPPAVEELSRSLLDRRRLAHRPAGRRRSGPAVPRGAAQYQHRP